ncbi:unnamed protein product [Zymoseptoria tritici ST99CH_3D1]|nr:unnamed protein product [Zymoseptoria tritici ST99CH_3D1]
MASSRLRFEFDLNPISCVQKSNYWNIPESARHACDRVGCAVTGTLTCKRCMFHRYCSKICQKKAWKSHKATCVPYRAQPVYDIVSLQQDQPNYFRNSAASPRMDRPNVAVNIRQTGCPSRVLMELMAKLFAELQVRTGYYNQARYPKTVIILRDQEGCEELFKQFEHLFGNQLVGPDLFNTLVRRIDQTTTAEARIAFLEKWSHPGSEVRIVITSPNDDDEMVVADVENVVVLEVETPDRCCTRWQRMARMCGQQGVYLAISPTVKFLVEDTINEAAGKKFDMRTDPWIPAMWKGEKERIFKNIQFFEKKWEQFSLQKLGDAVQSEDFWFADGDSDDLISARGSYFSPTPDREKLHRARLAEWVAEK